MNPSATDYLAALIRRGRAAGEVPEIDSDAWRALPDSDVRRVAAVAQAALLWVDYWQPASIRQRIEDEMAVDAQLAAAEWDRTTARIRRITSAPSYAKVSERGRAS